MPPAAAEGFPALLQKLAIAGPMWHQPCVSYSLQSSPPPVAAQLAFLRSLMANPAKVGAIAPSGPALARMMTIEASPHSGLVVELGPGTGVFTCHLRARGVAENRLLLVETDRDFAAMLQRRYPAARVIRADAARLIGHEMAAPGSVGLVVSGLPLLNMSPRQVMRVLGGAFALLRADGGLYQFTYRPRCPVAPAILDRLGLTATRVGSALLNAPPAWVYRIARRSCLPPLRLRAAPD